MSKAAVIALLVAIVNVTNCQLTSLNFGGYQHEKINSNGQLQNNFNAPPSNNRIKRQGWYYPEDFVDRFPKTSTTRKPYQRPPFVQNDYQTPRPAARPTYAQTTRTTKRTTQSTTTRRLTAPASNRVDGKLRKSEAMCKEYAKKIKKTSQFGSLSLDPSAQNISLAGCNWVTGLIVGGVNANTGEFPHMAAIGYPNLDKKIAFLCGGSLISDQFVLTAAHCKRADRVAPTTVRLGGLNLASKFKAVKEVDIPIATFIPHEAYDSETKQNDIGLIRMRFPVTFSSEVRPACLWQKANINEPRAIASGWGYQKYQGSSSDELKKVQLDIYSNSECTNSYSDEDFIINQNQVCAGFLPGGRDTCQGDSGGPLQVLLPENQCMYGILGVTSFGSVKCGHQNSPSVYTRVSAYLDWIETKVWP